MAHRSGEWPDGEQFWRWVTGSDGQLVASHSGASLMLWRPLYQSFDETEKRRFDILSRGERQRSFALFRGGDRGEFRFRRGQLRGPGREFPTLP
jgi:hypothetical protein